MSHFNFSTFFAIHCVCVSPFAKNAKRQNNNNENREFLFCEFVCVVSVVVCYLIN